MTTEGLFITNESNIEPGRSNPLSLFNLNTWYIVEGAHAADNYTLYNSAVSRIWVLGTTWAYSKYSNFANSSDSDVNSTVTCLHANEISDPASNSNDGGNGDGEKEDNEDEKKQEDGDSGAACTTSNTATSIVLFTAISALCYFM